MVFVWQHNHRWNCSHCICSIRNYCSPFASSHWPAGEVHDTIAVNYDAVAGAVVAITDTGCMATGADAAVDMQCSGGAGDDAGIAIICLLTLRSLFYRIIFVMLAVATS